MRDHAKYLQVAYGSSERRTCQVLTFGRSTCRYESVAAEQAALRMRLKDLAQARVSYGYRRLHILLQREGWVIHVNYFCRRDNYSCRSDFSSVLRF